MSQLTLFVIIDPTQEHQQALARAAEIANIAGGHIHAFCAVYEDDLSSYTSRRDAKYEVKHRAMDKIDELINPLVNDRVSVDREVIWNGHWYQAAVHACARVGADYMIKSADTHRKILKALGKDSDHYILHHIPCPVLLVQSVEPGRYLRVLAAVVIEDGDNNDDKLNNLIVSNARRICRMTGGDLRVVATHKDRKNIFSFLRFRSDGDDEKLPDEQLISSHFGIEADKIHLASGSARQVVMETAMQNDTQLLVMGSLAREGISGAVLGNTCERILDQLSIDILAVY